MSPTLTAQRIVVDEDAQTFTIDWADQHRTCYPLDALRRACPCAGCRGGHAHMHTLPDPSLFTEPPRRRWEKLRIERVGSYALRLIWDDSHAQGIYTWERLRAMCPCESCVAA